MPSISQRCTSSSTLSSVNTPRLARSDSNTLTITLRRRAPAAVLLARPALRSRAGPRCSRSRALLVGATPGCSTNVNSSSSTSRPSSSLARLHKSRSGGVASAVATPLVGQAQHAQPVFQLGHPLLAPRLPQAAVLGHPFGIMVQPQEFVQEALIL